MGQHERAENLRKIGEEYGQGYISGGLNVFTDAADSVERDEWPEKVIETNMIRERTLLLLLARTEFLMNRIEELQHQVNHLQDGKLIDWKGRLG